MITSRGLIVNGRVELDQTHNPSSIEFHTKNVRPRCSKLANEEILSVESDAIDDMEYQSLHGAFKFSFRRISFDRLESTPQNMVHCAWQVLEVLHKEFFWIFSVVRQWLHQAKYPGSCLALAFEKCSAAHSNEADNQVHRTHLEWAGK